MRRGLLFVLLLSIWGGTWAQSAADSVLLPQKPGPKYLEDQIFFQFTYIILKNLYPGIVQQGFSNSVAFGFIRDIPVNRRRNIGFGAGFGYERSIYYQNLKIEADPETGEIRYTLLRPDSYRLNAFGIKRLVFPLEFRLRGSTAEKFKFWRFYGGITWAYTVGAFSDYENDRVSLRYRRLKHLPSRFQYGLHAYAGYADLNAYLYVGLNDLFSPDVKIENRHVPLQDIRFGVMLTFL